MFIFIYKLKIFKILLYKLHINDIIILEILKSMYI